MQLSPLLLFHICCGFIVLLSGAAAMSFRKGSRRHGMAGNIFVIFMMSLSATGTYLGLVNRHVLNTLMGPLAFYLVATAWVTARRKSGETGILERGALLTPLVVELPSLLLG